ncbi:MAG: hypothetical protein CM15mP49_26160 [Actinomycetota bacterium]|nr:MAG: hypothetical protein CM15mP49_26160 [Actinomycetota bacterium]
MPFGATKSNGLVGEFHPFKKTMLRGAGKTLFPFEGSMNDIRVAVQQ